MNEELNQQLQQAVEQGKPAALSEQDFKKALGEIESILDEPLDKPNDRFYLNIVDQEAKEIFMSAGLLRKLVSLLEANGGDTLENNKMFLDAGLQNQISLEVLVGRSLHGDELYKARLDAQTLMDDKVTIEEGERLVTWVREHVLHFFMNSLKTLFKAGIDEKGAYQKLMLSLNGLGLLQQRSQ